MRTAERVAWSISASLGLWPRSVAGPEVHHDQAHELARGEIGIVEVEMAAMGEPRQPRRNGRPDAARPPFAPSLEELRITLAFGLDQLQERRRTPVAQAIGGKPPGEGGQLRLEILGVVRESRQRGEQAGIGLLGRILHDGREHFFLVADLIVDGLARDAGLGGDHVDRRPGESLARKNPGCGFENVGPFRDLTARRGGVEGRFSPGGHGVRIMSLD